MQKAGENEVHVTADPFAVEAGEKRCRRRTIKALVVIKDPNSQTRLPT
jgi:hypothetical protein